jgi:hypothetical protein
MGALQLPTIDSLQVTNEKMSMKQRREYEGLKIFTKSTSTYRKALQDKKLKDKPCIPWLGMYS